MLLPYDRMHAPRQPAQRQRSLEPGRVLVVDDARLVRTMLQGVLQGEGYQVDTAAGRTVALAILGKKPYGVVVTDLNMEAGDGPGPQSWRPTKRPLQHRTALDDVLAELQNARRVHAREMVCSLRCRYRDDEAQSWVERSPADGLRPGEHPEWSRRPRWPWLRFHGRDGSASYETPRRDRRRQDVL